MPFIEIKQLTKDFGHGRGIFNVQLSIAKGEVFGFVGTNGAGKSTTIRHLMGFLKPEKGQATINGLDCWSDAADIKRLVGYVPGEIAFPDAPTGTDFLKRQAELLNVTDVSFTEEIIEKLQLDPTANLKRMSKGMKQKTAIVAALMADPEILILDEPTTGLDPLMRVKFMEILEEEKKRGKTIFMSSHMFEEVEHICDKVALIKEGKIIDVKATGDIKNHQEKVYEITFQTKQDYQRFLSEAFMIAHKQERDNLIQVQIHHSDLNDLMNMLKNYNVKSISEIKYTLEQYFNNLYVGRY